MPRAVLLPHPATPCPAVADIAVAAAWTADGGPRLTYRLSGDPAGLRVPAAPPVGRRDGLWRHTCCEAFVMAGPGPGYREFNFSPAGDWAAYVFRAYRDGSPLEPATPPSLCCRAMAGGLELEAVLAAALLPAGRPLRLGLSAVVEAADGRLSYWALRHPPGRPDFHHTDGLALTLDPAPTS